MGEYVTAYSLIECAGVTSSLTLYPTQEGVVSHNVLSPNSEELSDQVSVVSPTRWGLIRCRRVYSVWSRLRPAPEIWRERADGHSALLSVGGEYAWEAVGAGPLRVPVGCWG